MMEMERGDLTIGASDLFQKADWLLRSEGLKSGALLQQNGLSRRRAPCAGETELTCTQQGPQTSQ